MRRGLGGFGRFDTLTTRRTGGRVDDSLPGAQTSQDSSAESHAHQSNKVCELFETVSLILTGRSVHVHISASLWEKCQCKGNCVTALALEYLVILVFCKLVHQHNSASSMTAGSYFSLTWVFEDIVVRVLLLKAVRVGFSLSYKYAITCGAVWILKGTTGIIMNFYSV